MLPVYPKPVLCQDFAGIDTTLDYPIIFQLQK